MAQSSKQRAETAVLDLKTKLRQLNNELTSKGVTVAVNAPLIDTIKAVAMMKVVREEVPMTLYKDSQLYQWVDEALPPMKLKEGVAVSLRYTFSEMKSLTALPDIAGLERANNISCMCKYSSSLRFAALPDLPKCTDATEAFSYCTSIESIGVGNVPMCTSFYCFALSAKAVKSITIGDAPLVANVNSVAYDCPALEEFTANFGNKINNARYMFYNCAKLRRINGVLDFSSATDFTSTFSYCSSLEEVRIKTLKASIDLSQCANLSLDSIRYLINNAQNVLGNTITLNSSIADKYGEDIVTIGDKATEKGWTINYR